MAIKVVRGYEGYDTATQQTTFVEAEDGELVRITNQTKSVTYHIDYAKELATAILELVGK